MKLKLIILTTVFHFIFNGVNVQWQKIPLTHSLFSYYNYYTSVSFVSDTVGFLSGCSGPGRFVLNIIKQKPVHRNSAKPFYLFISDRFDLSGSVLTFGGVKL